MSATSLPPHMRNGNGESLSRAKAALKGRLKQQMMQDVLDELQDTAPIVQEAMEAFASQEEALREAKEALKASLLRHIRHQAVEEVVAEIQVGAPEAYAEEDDLTLARAAFKQQLLDHVLQQAIREVGAEIRATPEALGAHEEALGEATAAFKARLREQTIRQAIESIDATPEALDAHEEALGEATAAFKARLREQTIRQAIEAVEAEARDGAEHLLPQADENALAGIKAAFKQQLLDGIYQQAIDEIDAEVDSGADDLTTLSLVAEEAVVAEPAVAEAEPIPDFTMDIPDEGRGLEDVEEAYLDEADVSERFDDDPVLDVRFWDDPADDLVDGDALPPVELSLPEDEIEEESGFFLSDRSEAGSDSGASASIEESIALFDDLLDFDGHGAWEATMPYDDGLLEPSSGPVDDPFEMEDEGVVFEGPGTVYYLYGIFSSESASAATFTIPGIDPVYPVYPLEHEGAVALVSNVPGGEYGQEALAVNLLDSVWTEQRAKLHDTVIEQVSAKGLFLPVPFATTFTSEEAVRAAFPGYLEELDRLQGRSQWRVRLYRNVDVLHQKVVESSPAVQQLMADIKSKAKKGGQSIKKQMVETIHEEEATLTDACTKGVHERLFARADDVELGALEGENERDQRELILDATYLVHRGEQAPFQSDIEALVIEYAPLGFEFDVAGPESPALFSHVKPALSP